MPIVRRIIKPTRKHGAIYMIERVAFRDKPVRITLEIDPEVTIDKLVFQPVRKKLPPAAAAYVPKIVPRPDRPRLLVNRGGGAGSAGSVTAAFGALPGRGQGASPSMRG